jgi:hypothetical protein
MMDVPDIGAVNSCSYEDVADLQRISDLYLPQCTLYVGIVQLQTIILWLLEFCLYDAKQLPSQNTKSWRNSTWQTLCV